MDGFQECINGTITSDTSLDIFKKEKEYILTGFDKPHTYEYTILITSEITPQQTSFDKNSIQFTANITTRTWVYMHEGKFIGSRPENGTNKENVQCEISGPFGGSSKYYLNFSKKGDFPEKIQILCVNTVTSGGARKARKKRQSRKKNKKSQSKNRNSNKRSKSKKRRN